MYRPHKNLWTCLLYHHYCFPVEDNHIQHNIEDGGENRVGLRETPVAFEWGAILAPQPFHHDESSPVLAEKDLCPCLYVIPHCHQMLEQLGLERDGTHTLEQPKPMKYIVLVDQHPNVAVNHP